jgi:hypothetical protein
MRLIIIWLVYLSSRFGVDMYESQLLPWPIGIDGFGPVIEIIMVS